MLENELHRSRAALAALLAERDVLRQQYGRNSLRAKSLDKAIQRAVDEYKAERAFWCKASIAEAKARWGKRLGWTDADFDE